MKSINIISVLAMLLIMTSHAEAKKVNLRYQLKTGDQFTLELSLLQDIDQVSGTQLMNSKSLRTNTYDFKVTGVSGTGDMTISVALKAFNLESSGPQFGEMKYNSSDQTPVPEFAIDQAALLNQAYSFTLSPLGKITDVQLPAGLLEKLKELFAGTSASKMGFDVNEMIKEFDGPKFTETLKLMFTAFPAGGTEITVPWKEETSINPRVQISNLTSDCTLTNSSAEGNQIKVEGKISADKNAYIKEMFGLKVSFEFEGTRNGSLILDPKTGISNTAEFQTSMTGSLVINSPQMPAPNKIPMTIKATEKVTKR